MSPLPGVYHLFSLMFCYNNVTPTRGLNYSFPGILCRGWCAVVGVFHQPPVNISTPSPLFLSFFYPPDQRHPRLSAHRRIPPFFHSPFFHHHLSTMPILFTNYATYSKNSLI